MTNFGERLNAAHGAEVARRRARLEEAAARQRASEAATAAAAERRDQYRQLLPKYTARIRTSAAELAARIVADEIRPDMHVVTEPSRPYREDRIRVLGKGVLFPQLRIPYQVTLYTPEVRLPGLWVTMHTHREDVRGQGERVWQQSLDNERLGHWGYADGPVISSTYNKTGTAVLSDGNFVHFTDRDTSSPQLRDPMADSHLQGGMVTDAMLYQCGTEGLSGSLPVVDAMENMVDWWEQRFIEAAIRGFVPPRH